MNKLKKIEISLIIFQLIFISVQFSCTNTKRTSSSEDDEGLAKIDLREKVSQYGITWTFNKPVKSGQFINGDWRVIGPATIVEITPSPGPTNSENVEFKENKWGDTSIKNDNTMRNGSMISLEVGNQQGYDSRANSYSEDISITLPVTLAPDRSLISSISNTTLPVDNFAKNIMWPSEKKSEVVMKIVAVLTSLKEALRPMVSGHLTQGQKNLYFGLNKLSGKIWQSWNQREKCPRGRSLSTISSGPGLII